MTLQQWGLSATDTIRSILQRAPQVLLLNPQHLQGLYRFLGGTCGLSGSIIKDFVAASSLVLMQDVQQQLQPRVELLQQVIALPASQPSTWHLDPAPRTTHRVC
jgi:hypothetical protein